MLGAKELVDSTSLGRFLYSCQFKYGGISKAPGESPGKRIQSAHPDNSDLSYFSSDPYHTYLSLAALSMYSPESEYVPQHARSSWQFEPLDPLLNAREQTARWALDHISQRTL
jgi:geranylgeranyl transferase type-1 subunit beta